jgi:hypothetical protein
VAEPLGGVSEPEVIRGCSDPVDVSKRKANLALVDLIRRIAQRKRATPAEVALACLLGESP